jgi:glutamyl-tRNA(Gln) amidotransferase subunit E
VFADEIADRLKVIACLEKPNMTHSEDVCPVLNKKQLDVLKSNLEEKTWILFQGSEQDVPTAIETIEERCRLAFEGVPNETRKSMPDGTTVFERVLPGPDRMYPDTDSAPIPVEDAMIEKIQKKLPVDISNHMDRLSSWKAPQDAHLYLLKRNFVPVIQEILRVTNLDPRFLTAFCGHTLRWAERSRNGIPLLEKRRLMDLFSYIKSRQLHPNILKPIIKVLSQNRKLSFDAAVKTFGYQSVSREAIIEKIPVLRKQFDEMKKTARKGAREDWIMGQLRPLAIGNMDLKVLREAVGGGGQ